MSTADQQPTTVVATDQSVADFDDALARAFANVERAQADGLDQQIKKNGQARRYVTLASVDRAARDALTNEGFSYPQLASTHVRDGDLWLTITTQLRRKGVAIVASLDLPVLGQMIAASKGGGFQPPTAQSVGSAMTYGRRYALTALLGVCPDDDDDGHAASRGHEPQPDPALERLHEATAELARLRHVTAHQAQELICSAAETWPNGSPSPREIAALTAAALVLLAEPQEPRPGKPGAPPEPEPTELEQAQAAFAQAGQAYREKREADYLDAECRSPGRATIDAIRDRAVGIACRAAGVERWPGKAATLEQLRAATEALVAGRVEHSAKPEPSEPSPREAWRAAQKAYVDARAADYLREEGGEPDADALAGFTAAALEISHRAVGLKRWPARPKDSQWADAAVAMLDEAKAVRS